LPLRDWGFILPLTLLPSVAAEITKWATSRIEQRSAARAEG